MKTWRILAAASLLAVGSALPVSAQQAGEPWETAADLARFCRMEDKTFCYGFMAGAWQFYEQLVAADAVDVDPFVCPGDEVTADEAVAIFTDWAGAHQDELAQPAVDGLFRAWTAAFPCNEG